jgi:RNA polymerase sigma-B factor
MDPHDLRDLASRDLDDILTALRHPTSTQQRSALEGEVVRRHRMLARRIVGRYVHRGVDVDDLVAVADLAMLKALRRYDPELGTFAGFAVTTIVGEIKKQFRDHGWMIRPPRRIQELQAHIGEVTEKSLHAGRWPGRVELAAMLDVPVSEVTEALTAKGNFALRSLDAAVGRGGEPLGSIVPATDRSFQEVEDRMCVLAACARLTPSDQELVWLRFFEDRSQVEIADLTGASQMQVSRRLRRILDSLRGDVAVDREEGAMAMRSAV